MVARAHPLLRGLWELRVRGFHVIHQPASTTAAAGVAWHAYELTRGQTCNYGPSLARVHVPLVFKLGMFRSGVVPGEMAVARAQ